MMRKARAGVVFLVLGGCCLGTTQGYGGGKVGIRTDVSGR